jgi:hypothetical protein
VKVTVYALVDGGVKTAKLNKLMEPDVISLTLATFVNTVAVEFCENIVDDPE